MHTLEELIAIYQEHYRELVVHALMVARTKELAEDLVQDLAEKIVRDPGQFACAETVVAYFKTCITNAARTRARREKRILLTEPEIVEFFYRQHAAPHPGDVELAMDLEQALSKCSPLERRILVLKYTYGYRLREIAAILGTNVNALSQQLFRLKKKLEKRLRRERLLVLVLLLAPAPPTND